MSSFFLRMDMDTMQSRVRRLELIAFVLFEQLSTGSITVDHQEMLVKFIKEIASEMDQEETERSKETPTTDSGE